MNAQTSPSAQYTLVSISGRNSKFVLSALPLSDDLRVKTGKRMTKAWSSVASSSWLTVSENPALIATK